MELGPGDMALESRPLIQFGWSHKISNLPPLQVLVTKFGTDWPIYS